MRELFGLAIQPSVSTGNVITWTLIFAVAVMWWIRGIPDRTRARNEGRVIDHARDERQYREWRAEVHGYKNEVMGLRGELAASDKKLAEMERLLAHTLSTSSVRKEQMNSMMSLIELLIAELERIDEDSIIVPQAKVLLKQMRDAAARTVEPLKMGDPTKSDALNTAEGAVLDAKQTLASTKDTCEEVKRVEGNGK